MKHKGKILAAVVASVALLTVAASYFGSVTTVSTMHATTNGIVVALGQHQASVVRTIPPSNLVAVQNTVILPRTNLAGLYASTNILALGGSTAKPAFGFSEDDDGTGTGLYRFAANQPSLAINGSTVYIWDSTTFRIVGATATIRLGDTYFVQDDVATLQHGLDAATATGQIIKGPDGTGANGTGGALTNAGGRATGTGRGGAVVLATSRTLGTGSTVQTNSPRHYIEAKSVTLTESSATTVANVAVGAARYVGIRLMATTFASDGTDHQAVTETIAIAAVNKAGTVTTAISAASPTATIQSSGTLVCTWTAVVNGNSVDIKNSAVSSLTQTTLSTDWRIEVDSNEATGITPQ